MTRSRAAAKADVSDERQNMLNSDLRSLIDAIVSENTNKLLIEIQALRQEVVELKQQLSIKYEHLPSPDVREDLDSSSETVIDLKNEIEIENKNEKVQYKQGNTSSNTIRTRKMQKWPISGTSDAVVGTASVSTTNSNFAGAPRKLWIYVGKCLPNSTEEAVRRHLEEKLPEHNFNVVKLNSKGTYSSYRVEADLGLKDELYAPSFWPSGVIVKRFKFPRNIHIRNGNVNRPF
nr:unnamed protein product [Callosobruchus analis]